MTPRAADLVRTLDLTPHPEGGFFREIHRSPATVRTDDGRSARNAMTAIYFLLPAGRRSRWHRVLSDEAWIHVEGAPLELWRMDAALADSERIVLGPLEDGTAPVAVIPAGDWQAARSLGAYTLVSCLVGPGFDFADFSLMEEDGDEARRIREHHPALADFI